MDRKAVYYHGCVVDYFDLDTGRAVVEILERVGCTVEVPELICCSFPLLNSGDFQAARKRATELIRVLAEYVESGHQVVYSCPTCGHALKEAYPKLLGKSARDVADNTHFISSYLLDLVGNARAELKFDDRPRHMAYHTPCHLRTQDLSTASVELLNLVPKLDVVHVDKGCCGMGGTWALRSKRRGELGAEAGSALFEDIHDRQPQIVATDCFGCGIQIARNTQVIPLHPMQILLDSLIEAPQRGEIQYRTRQRRSC
ncbi:heterodisulfide reductase-related iron-sulfur binding cluster [Chloroflexota bacterium]